MPWGAKALREGCVTKMQFYEGVSNKLQKYGGATKQKLVIFPNFINKS